MSFLSFKSPPQFSFSPSSRSKSSPFQRNKGVFGSRFCKFCCGVVGVVGVVGVIGDGVVGDGVVIGWGVRGGRTERTEEQKSIETLPLTTREKEKNEAGGKK